MNSTPTPLACGVTGAALVALLERAAGDYRSAVSLPSPHQAEGWVVSRTGVGGPFAGQWSLAPVSAVRTAPRQCPANAEGARQYPYARCYHPSLRDLRTICRIISAPPSIG